MSLSFAITTALEVLTGLFLIWGFLNEEKFVALEDRILARLRKKTHRPPRANYSLCAA